MSYHVEQMPDGRKHYEIEADLEDQTAMKVCLLSVGALAGMALKGTFLRRIAGVACTILAVGLAIPLTVQYLEEHNLKEEENDESVDTTAAEETPESDSPTPPSEPLADAP